MASVTRHEAAILEHAEVVVENTDLLSDDEFNAARRPFIGGGDAAAACGLSTWESPVELYYHKRGEIPPKERTEAMELGIAMEPVIGKLFTTRTGIETVRFKKMLRSRKWEHMSTNLDFLAPTEPAVVEAKNVGFRMAHEWIGDNTEVLLPPAHYALQGQHELAVTGERTLYYAVAIGGQRFRYVKVERDTGLIETLVEMEYRFLELVRNGTPPDADASASTRRALLARYPEETPGVMQEADDTIQSLIEERAAVKAQIKAHQDHCNLIENKLRMWLGEAEGATLDGKPLVTYKRIDRDGYEVQPSSYRKLTFKRQSNRRTA